MSGLSLQGTLLVLAPHTDDAELGCGGTIARFIEEGIKVYVVTFSSASTLPEFQPNILENEFRLAMPILGVPEDCIKLFNYQVRQLSYHRQEVLETLVELRATIKPDIVMLPSGNDIHQDHQVVYAEGLRAFKDISMLGYELSWNHINFAAETFVVLEKKHIDKKWQALQCYESQRAYGRLYMTREYIESIARVRGTQVKTEWAESFEVIRIRL